MAIQHSRRTARLTTGPTLRVRNTFDCQNIAEHLPAAVLHFEIFDAVGGMARQDSLAWPLGSLFNSQAEEASHDPAIH